MRKHTSTLLAAVAASILVTSGCAGGGAATTGGPPPPPNHPFEGQFFAGGDLDNGKGANMLLTVDENGQVTGTLDVAPPPASPSRAPFVFPVGSHPVTGTVTTAGAINLGGTAGEAGTFTVTGFLPNSIFNTNYTIKAGESTFTGTVGYYEDPGATVITFSNPNQTNANLAPWVSTDLSTEDRDDDETRVETQSRPGGKLRILTVSIKDDMAVGSEINAFSKVILNDYLSGLFPNAWSAKTGKIKLLARNGMAIKVELIDVKMEAVSGLGGEGSFEIDGVIDAK